MTRPTKAGKAIAVGLSLGALGAFTWWALKSRASYYDAWVEQLDGSFAGGILPSDFEPVVLETEYEVPQVVILEAS